MESLVLFMKQPFAGETKTRLAHGRNDREALLLYTAFLADFAAVCNDWRRQKIAVDPNRRLVIAVTPDQEDPVVAEIVRRSGARCVLQSEGDLGDRLAAVFEAEFERGARAVCAIGSDTPTLPRYLIDQAFRTLRWERAVLGPTFDGGYWLAGAQRPAPDMFSDIPWSTPSVLMRTLFRLEKAGITPQLLPFWYDIDDAEDLERLVWHLRAVRAAKPGACPATWEALQRIGLVQGSPPES